MKGTRRRRAAALLCTLGISLFNALPAPATESIPFLQVGGVKNGQPDPTLHHAILPPEQSLRWKVELKHGDQLALGMMVTPPEDAASIPGLARITADIIDPTGNHCVSESNDGTAANEFTQPISGFATSYVVGDTFGNCAPGAYDIVITRKGTLGGTHELPLDFTLWKIPTAATDTIATSAPPPELSMDIDNSAATLHTATTLNDAPTVHAGSYETTLHSGTTQWLRIPIAEGQRLQIAIEAPPTQGTINWAVIGPNLYPVDIEEGTNNYGETTIPYRLKLDTTEVRKVTSITQEIRWGNIIEDTEFDHKGGFLAGEQNVALRYSADTPQSTTIRLALRAVGNAEPGPKLSYGVAGEAVEVSDGIRARKTSRNNQPTSPFIPIASGALLATAILVLGMLFMLRRR